MKVSICLPTMGRFKMLEQALYSILVQPYPDWELVMNDGDPSAPAVKEPRLSKVLELIGDKLSYKAERDKGLFYAYNDCLNRVTGDVVHFMCSDDLMSPGALSTVNEAFEAERFSKMFWLYGKTVSADERFRRLGTDGEPTTYEKLLVKNRIGQNAVFVGRGLIELEAGFDVRYRHAADYELWLRLWRRREPLFVNEELGVYRHHDAQTTRLHTDDLERDVSKMTARHRCLADVVSSARVTWATGKLYGGSELPRSEN